MPKLPDITVYREALEPRVVGTKLVRVDVKTLFVLRTARPLIEALVDQRETGLRRLGKRIALGFANGHWLVLHLMVAGRFSSQDMAQKSLAASKADGCMAVPSMENKARSGRGIVGRGLMVLGTASAIPDTARH